MKPHIRYQFHHMGIPDPTPRPGAVESVAAGMFTTDNPGKFRVQWHRFTEGSPLHPLIRTVPHMAFKVEDLAAEAIAGEELLLGPYEPIDGFHVAIINDAGVPVELIQTDLPDAEVWARARAGQGALYRDAGLDLGPTGAEGGPSARIDHSEPGA